MSDLSPEHLSLHLLVDLNVSEVKSLTLSLDELKESICHKDVCFNRIKKEKFETDVLKIGFNIFFFEIFFI